MPPMFSIDHPVWEVADLARLGVTTPTAYLPELISSQFFEARNDPVTMWKMESNSSVQRGAKQTQNGGGGETNPKW